MTSTTTTTQTAASKTVVELRFHHPSTGEQVEVRSATVYSLYSNLSRAYPYPSVTITAVEQAMELAIKRAERPVQSFFDCAETVVWFYIPEAQKTVVFDANRY